MQALAELICVKIWRGNRALELSKEVTSSAAFIFAALCIRALLSFIRILSYIPEGFIFSLPVVFMYFARTMKLDFLLKYYPNISVRISEAFLGRLDIKHIPEIFIAHIIGTLFGVVFFYTCTSWMCSDASALLLPIRASAYGNNDIYSDVTQQCASMDNTSIHSATNATASSTIANEATFMGSGGRNTVEQHYGYGYRYDNNNNSTRLMGAGAGPLLYTVIIDTIFSCLCTLCILILPEVLRINKMKWHLVLVPLAALLLLHSLVVGKESLSSAMSPEIAAVFWFIHNNNSSSCTSYVASGSGHQLLPNLLRLSPLLANILDLLPFRLLFCLIQLMKSYILYSTAFVEQVLGNLLGGVIAGMVGVRLTPDDEVWRRR